ncbi:unnamed protein product [Cylindrotheca closterium]|uniref:BZIP domain-containing protein n=1 Tax=Cylindrotheca closterium TaxID=2856 RepID=A0AAD2FK17_9STRA|nr:unnamed protein product [Cylindrotheca closterium]
MQATHQPCNPAIPPSGTQVQEMFELSTWLDDVFTSEQQPTPFTAPSPDLEIEPDMFLSTPIDGMDHEVDIIASSDGLSSLDLLDIIHPVSPTTSPCASITTDSLVPEMDAFKLQPQAEQPAVSLPPTKRKQPSASTHLVSDSSDNEDATRRSPKRQRKAQHTTKPVKAVSAPVKSKPQSVVAATKVAISNLKTKIPDVAVKKQIRREKNREHAKKSRSKKRDYNTALEESVMALREENKKLRELVCSQFGEAKAATMVKERIRTPEDKMIEALKKPSNKVLSKSVVHFLQSLRSDIKMKPSSASR